MAEDPPKLSPIEDVIASTPQSPRGHDLENYTRRLQAQRAWWKRVLNTQAPYAWNVRRLVRGRVLDIGCGVGRNLLHLDGNGVGVDTNEHSVAVARERGLVAYTADAFPSSADGSPGRYSTLLIAHVLEHMNRNEATAVLGSYLPYLAAGGRVVVIVPQEAGFRSDPTHVSPVDRRELMAIADEHGLLVDRIASFPLPRFVGKLFKHNETVAVMHRPD